MRRASVISASLAALLLTGCVAKTALNVVTAPVRAGSQVADWATTSQDEADRARGREIRRREERLADLEQDCLDGDDDACRDAVTTRREIEELLATPSGEGEDS